MLTIVFKYNSCVLPDVFTIYSVFDELIFGLPRLLYVILTPISEAAKTLKPTPTTAYFKYFLTLFKIKGACYTLEFINLRML